MTREEALRRIHRAAEENLTELDLAGLELEELPPEIGKCTQLEKLVLGRVKSWRGGADGKMTPQPTTNQLTLLPDELLSLGNLRAINLSCNPFGKMPELLLEMKQLESLNLTSIGLTEIPEYLGRLSNLTKIDLSFNRLNLIEDILEKEVLGKLCKILCQLSKLTHIHLCGNQIAEIPEALCQLSNLTHLDLFSNHITQIPEAVTQLSSLMLLKLRRNEIAEIPDKIAQLSNLAYLVIRLKPISRYARLDN